MNEAPILLTGGTGFIGHHLARGLTAAGYPLRYLVQESSNLNSLPQHLPSDIFKGDLEDQDVLKTALAGCSAVVHAAALVSFRSQDEAAMHRVNVNGTTSLVNVSLELQIPRFIHISSVAALNRESRKVTKLKDRWQETPSLTAYGRSKFAAEREVWRGQAEGLSVAVLYPSTVIGPGDWARSGSPALFAKADSRRFASAGHAGFVAVEDVVKAALFSLRSDMDGLRILLNADNLSWKNALEMIAASVDKPKSLPVLGPTISGAFWPVASLFAAVTRQSPTLTRDLHRTAQADYRYDGSSYEEITGEQYRSVAEAIEATGKVFLRER